MQGPVFQANVFFCRNNLEFGGHQKTQRAVAPGNQMKQFAVFRGAAVFQLTIRGDDIEGLADVLEQAILVAAGFHAKAHDETADGQVVQLRHHREDPAAGNQRA